MGLVSIRDYNLRGKPQLRLHSGGVWTCCRRELAGSVLHMDAPGLGLTEAQAFDHWAKLNRRGWWNRSSVLKPGYDG